MTSKIEYQIFGAQLRQVSPGDIFYTSPLSVNKEQCLRGGQPIVFPQFADSGGLKKHGFARNITWDLLAEERAPLRHRIVLAKTISEGEVSGWPYDARIELDVKFFPGRVLQTFAVSNTGCKTFSWTGGLHPYFAVADISSASLKGLDGVIYQDRYRLAELLTGPFELRWGAEPCEKLFETNPDLELITGNQQIQLSSSGFDQWMIWNPGEEGAKAISDLPDEDWNKFVCIEPVRVDNPVTLNPGENFLGSFEIRFDALNEKTAL